MKWLLHPPRPPIQSRRAAGRGWLRRRALRIRRLRDGARDGRRVQSALGDRLRQSLYLHRKTPGHPRHRQFGAHVLPAPILRATRGPLPADAVSLYGYCNESPLITADPYGLTSFDLIEYSGSAVPIYWMVKVSLSENTRPCCDGTNEGTTTIGVLGEIGIGISQSITIFDYSFKVNFHGPRFYTQWDIECERACGEKECCKACAAVGINIGQEWGLGVGIISGCAAVDIQGELKVCYNFGEGCKKEGFTVGFCGNMDAYIEYKIKLFGNVGDTLHLPGLPVSGCKAFVGQDEML